MNFYQTVNAAVRYFTENGYESDEALNHWVSEIRKAAERDLTPESTMQKIMRAAFEKGYERVMRNVQKTHPGIPRWTINRIQPQLRAELDRRIMASANLIKLNREQAIETTLRRFQGWATSIPVGGSNVVQMRDESKHIRKSLGQLDFIQRRVAIDQGHKLTATLNEIVAMNSGAIAAVWHSHWRQLGYDYRVDHKERDGKYYLIKDSWAQKDGFVKVGPAGYYSDITKPGEEVFCRCSAQYVYTLRKMPDDMLTVKGREAMEKVRAA